MSRQVINDTYSLEIPDSFVLIPEEDLVKLSQGRGDPFNWGARDPESHAMILVIWKRYPGILSLLANPKDMVRRNEQMTQKMYEGHDYHLLEFFSIQAGDEQAEGYRFSYTAEGVSHVRNNFLVKDGKTVYAFICAGRAENAEADRATFLAVMESLEYA